MDVFIQYPELHAFNFDHSPNTRSATESVRLKVIAEQHADWLEVVLIRQLLWSWPASGPAAFGNAPRMNQGGR